MNVEMIANGKLKIAVVDGVALATPQDMLDLIAALHYQNEAEGLVIPKENLAEEFFDLRTGLAGEMLQKCTNYQMKIAIVGDFTVYDSKALRDFIRECNRGTSVFFLPGREDAVTALQNS